MRLDSSSAPPGDEGARLLYAQAGLMTDALLLTPSEARFGIPIGAIALATAAPSPASIDELMTAGLGLAADRGLNIRVVSRRWTEVVGYPALELEARIEIGRARLNWAMRTAIRAGGMTPINVRLHLFDRQGVRHLAAAIATHRAFRTIYEAAGQTVGSSEWPA
ncbi:MAG: hypothetical protein M3P14_04845 [Chloroflexota bacterium]|nr:hypothetical protein [Chloroflexota bacterium]